MGVQAIAQLSDKGISCVRKQHNIAIVVTKFNAK